MISYFRGGGAIPALGPSPTLADGFVLSLGGAGCKETDTINFSRNIAPLIKAEVFFVLGFLYQNKAARGLNRPMISKTKAARDRRKSKIENVSFTIEWILMYYNTLRFDLNPFP